MLMKLVTVNPWLAEALVGFTCLLPAPRCRCYIANERQFGILTPPATGRMIPGMPHLLLYHNCTGITRRLW